MRKRILIALLCCVGLFLLLGHLFQGVIIGRFWARRDYVQEIQKERELFASLNSRHIEATAYNDGYPTLSILEDLRRGDTNSAIRRLESRLDHDLLGIWHYYKQTPSEKLDSHEVDLLTKIQLYRVKYPRDTRSPQIDQPVAEVLSWTNNLVRK